MEKTLKSVYSVEQLPAKESVNLLILSGNAQSKGVAGMVILNGKKTIILARFYWQDLLKISSKVQNQRILIFYFVSSVNAASAVTAENVAKPPDKRSLKCNGGWKSSVTCEFKSVEEAKKCIVDAKDQYKNYKDKLYLK